ncbi:MAG TPA: phosphoribosylformylglycinamidine synthase subunit PurL [Frankiaceae bacterium]|nr:phosphoribosylformylglycinamidine synthase subunit PurL [Frankiaceae bacterium]
MTELVHPPVGLHRELGLTDDEYGRIVSTLGREPTGPELAMYSVMWSEHCSYKSSRIHLKQFGDLPGSERLLAGIGENAGVVDVGGGLAVTFKVESHNHPSYVEPYQGAATGVGGIIRDILAMGARPIAVMDSLRFGDAGAADTARVMPGIVAGVGGYGNCMGLPNIGGEVGFDPSYAGNPLVNALCIGILPAARLQTSAATGAGNAVVLLGAKTGRDGIGGVSVLASATFDETGAPARRPSVQVGDPFTEKIVTECVLELYERELVIGVQDLGGAGLSCAVSETAAKAGTGMDVDLDRVPLREPSMAPEEVLVSESQERMLAIVAPEQVTAVLDLAARWGVLASVIGTVTDTGRLVIRWHGGVVVDVPPESLADDGPVYTRPLSPRAPLPGAELPRPSADELGELLLRMIADPQLCSRRWVTEQYDRYVLGNTVLATPDDAGVLRLEGAGGRGIALALDGPARYCALDPYTGAQLALAEAYRNVAASGALPYAVTDCLNFGSPEEPEVMWAFAETCRGLADGCRALGLPVTGGNVSFYNATGGTAILPTPVIGVMGLFDDVERRTPSGFLAEGDAVYLLGDTADEFDGSAWSWIAHRHLGGTPPAIDLQRESVLAAVLVAGSREGLLTSAHDVSDGGLAITLAEMCLRFGFGARVDMRESGDPFVALFSESAARAVVAVPALHEERFIELCASGELPCRRIGVVTNDGDGAGLDVADVLALPLDQLRDAHEGTLPALLGDLAPTDF